MSLTFHRLYQSIVSIHFQQHEKGISAALHPDLSSNLNSFEHHFLAILVKVPHPHSSLYTLVNYSNIVSSSHFPLSEIILFFSAVLHWEVSSMREGLYLAHDWHIMSGT